MIVTDAFPPHCGGSGWSTYELAKGLRARGHEVLVAEPKVRWVVRRETMGDPHGYDGFHPLAFETWAPPVPFVRNYFGNERLYRRFGRWLVQLIHAERIDVVHAQHLRSGPAAVRAAQAVGVPVVCTVRDYWPVCYWSDLLYDAGADALCPGCSGRMMTRCLRPHAGRLWPAALGAIPYMQANLAAKRRALARADAIVAVSAPLARDLKVRAPELTSARIEVIPNPVDVTAIRAEVAESPRPLDEPYAIYVGKLAPNKGVLKLADAVARARLDWPLVIVGDGPERPALAQALRARGVRTHFRGWLPRSAALAWLRHAEFLIFPSRGPESLSRVLLEASALGVPIAAMSTGGTTDIIVHETTGLLSADAHALGDDVARLRKDPDLRRRLGETARRRVEAIFDLPQVAARMEALYHDVCRRGSARRACLVERHLP